MAVHERFPEYLPDQSEFFDLLATEDWHTYNWERRAVREAYDVAETMRIAGCPARVLQVGCGVGSQDPIIASYDFVREVHAIDPSAKCIEKADENFPHPKIKRWVSGYESLADDRSYDLTMSVDVFEHIDQPETFLRKMRNVTKPGGHVCILTPNRLRWQNLALRMQRKPPVLLSVMHYREYSLGEIKRMGRAEGLHYAGYFGEELYGPGVKLDLNGSLKWGRRLRRVAHVIGVVFKA